MRSVIPPITLALLTLVCPFSQAKFMRVETERVPISRLIANLERQLRQDPGAAEVHYALGRVQSMAFALKTNQMEVEMKTGKPWFGYMDRGEPPREIRVAGDPGQEKEARAHLNKAIEHYQRATQLRPDHLPALLGLGWCLDQSGDKQAALKNYRKALPLAWEREKKPEGFVGECLTQEIASYMLPLLDPKRDAQEIATVKGYQTAVSKIPRAVTPLLIPLQENLVLGDLIDPGLKVAFDLDGSGLKRNWGWITPKAGWLVFDRTGRDEITSGLQMIGGVTFWIFWQNGYQALAALDNDGDGILRGEELDGLAIWQDKNSNGVSEPGEVRSVRDWGITALAYQYENHASGIPFSPRGVTFQDGTTRPSFDWIARGESE